MALTIQNSTYANVKFADSPVTLTCKDNNGNTFTRTTIAVDTTLGAVAVNLPYIPFLADDLQAEVVIVVTDDTNAVTINAPVLPPPALAQSIGSAGTLTIPGGSGNGYNVVLRPISEQVWSAVITA